MASRGDRLGSRIAYDTGGLMHNSVHTSGAEIAKNTSPQQSSGGGDAAVATLIIAMLGRRKSVGPKAAILGCDAGTRRPEARGAPTRKHCNARRGLSSIIS
jgi:hypothetical protein